MRDYKDHATLEAMERKGGAFVQAIAHAARLADPQNYAILKKGFLNYWTTYEIVAANAKEKSFSHE